MPSLKRGLSWWLPVAVLAVVAGSAMLAPYVGSWNRATAPVFAAEKQTTAAKEAPSTAESRPVRVKTVRPVRRNLKRISTQPAQVEAYEKTEIFAKASGYLHKFGQFRDPGGRLADVDLGTVVGKHDVLAELWIPEMDQQKLQKDALVEQAQSDLEQAGAALTAAEALSEAVQAKVQEIQAEAARYAAEIDLRQSEHERFQQLARSRAVPEALVEEKLNGLRAAQARAEEAKASLLTAKANIRVQQAHVGKARADVASARSRLKVAELELKQTLVLLDYALIRAPFDGVVTRRLMDTGAFVQSAATGKPEPVFTIARVDRLRVLTDVPEADAPWIKPGQPATLVVDAARGQSFDGSVARTSDTLDPSTRTMRVEVELAQPSKLLKAGMFGAVAITLGDVTSALLVPANALLVVGKKPAVMLVDDGHARLQEVELGINDGVEVQIVAGLNGDETMIVEGKNQIRSGQTVEVSQ